MSGIFIIFVYICLKNKIMVNKISPESVCKAVALDFRGKGITQEAAGRAIGKNRTAIANLIFRRQYFSPRMAQLFSDKFGYSKNFLMFGEGELYLSNVSLVNEPNPSQSKDEIIAIANELKWNDEPDSLLCVIEVLESLLSISNNTELLNAWKCFKKRDLDGFLEHLRLVENSTGVKFTVPIAIVNLVMAQSRVVK